MYILHTGNHFSPPCIRRYKMIAVLHTEIYEPAHRCTNVRAKGTGRRPWNTRPALVQRDKSLADYYTIADFALARFFSIYA